LHPDTRERWGAAWNTFASATSGARFPDSNRDPGKRAARQRINQAALRESGPNRVPLIGRSIAILERDPAYLAVLEQTFGNLGANVFRRRGSGGILLARLGTDEDAPDLLLVGLLVDSRRINRGMRGCSGQTAGRLQGSGFPTDSSDRGSVEHCSSRTLTNARSCSRSLLAGNGSMRIARAMITNGGRVVPSQVWRERGLFLQRWKHAARQGSRPGVRGACSARVEKREASAGQRGVADR